MEKIEEASMNEEIIKRYDIVFIGGGPSTLSFFSYLAKKNELEKIMNTLNILVIEKNNCFGSGCLGKYGINSNTSAEGFVRLICWGDDEKSGEAKQALSPTKKKQDQTKSDVMEKENKTEASNSKTNKKNQPIPLFNKLYQSFPTQALLHIASKPAPLPLVGHFLDCIGNTLTNYINSLFNKNILLTNTEVVEVVMKKGVNKVPDIYQIKVQQRQGNRTRMFEIHSKLVIFANGGKQKFDEMSKNEIMKLINQKDFYHSDYFLQEQGYLNFLHNIRNNFAEKTKLKVVIIGGSHSGFSCAWMILNSPSEYRKYFKEVSSKEYEVNLNESCKNCSNNFCCFGSCKEKNWDNQFQLDNSKIEIEILYKNHIKVYYSSEREALNDGYNQYDPKKAVNKNGNVFPFIGIRGDAKELYRKIISGKETRVKLLRCDTLLKQKEYCQNASIVVWACGYTTNEIPLLDHSTKKHVDLTRDENRQIEVDKELNFKEKSGSVIAKLFGIGQGYSTHSIEVLDNGKTARADSVNLYNTHIAKKMLRNLEMLLTNKDGKYINDNYQKESQSINKNKEILSLTKNKDFITTTKSSSTKFNKDKENNFKMDSKKSPKISSKISLNSNSSSNPAQIIKNTLINASLETMKIKQHISTPMVAKNSKISLINIHNNMRKSQTNFASVGNECILPFQSVSQKSINLINCSLPELTIQKPNIEKTNDIQIPHPSTLGKNVTKNKPSNFNTPIITKQQLYNQINSPLPNIKKDTQNLLENKFSKNINKNTKMFQHDKLTIYALKERGRENYMKPSNLK
jgi:lysine/ornithine N-monooxygenase